MFLWVTGRAMELGRRCLSVWGYELKQELLWIKTNQLQKITRTGRTGHWFNHAKVPAASVLAHGCRSAAPRVACAPTCSHLHLNCIHPACSTAARA